jgi:3-dehydroquinate synthase
VTTIHVHAAGAPGYDVVIAPGALGAIADHVAACAPDGACAVVSDTTVAASHADVVVERLRGSGRQVTLLTFPAGEAHKTRETWASLTDRALEAGLGRDACFVGLGGGVTCDLAGFVAATFMRGVPCIQAPTSLLAMIDASIGGKTGVDTRHGKNLVGAFHQPRAVLVDPAVLATLPDVEFRSGLAEAVKHGAIADAEYLTWLERSADELFARDAAALIRLIETSVRIKARVVAADTDERGMRASLNFGHTVAHAIEAITDFDVPHGHAVAIGMVVEADVGETMGLTRRGSAAALARLLASLGLPTGVPAHVDADAAVRAMATDKKARAGAIRCALIERPGAAAATRDAWTVPVDPADLRAAVSSSQRATAGDGRF